MHLYNYTELSLIVIIIWQTINSNEQFIFADLSDSSRIYPGYQEKAGERDTTTSEASSSAVVSLLERLNSSATSERVFSLLKASFGPQQDCSLQDYIESSLMLQFNKR